jgi:MFS family permease
MRVQARLVSRETNGKVFEGEAMRAEKINRTILFVNWAHALDHFVLLIFPTAVIAIAADLHRDYSHLIWLSTGAFVAFGLFALPVGWLADRFGRRALLTWFFFGYGASCLLVAASPTFVALAAALLLLGIFSAIYHPIGSAMIVASAPQLGRALGINGVWGNMGAALASGITAAIAAALGWRAAFVVPGVILIATGIAFVRLTKEEQGGGLRKSVSHTLNVSRKHLVVLVVLFMAAILAGGFTFNIVTISMPKAIDEGFNAQLPLALTGWVTTGIFLCGAVTQLAMGRLIDRFELPLLFMLLAGVQLFGLILTAGTEGLPMAIGLTLSIMAIYGQVILNDAMVGRYVADKYRNRFYSWRFFIGFSVGGLAVPLIGAMHERGGFPAVFYAASAIASVIFLSALLTWGLTRGRTEIAALPAE